MMQRRSTIARTSGYRVFDSPVESPNHGLRTPGDRPCGSCIASPYGWHDANGVAGAEFTTCRGNNVRAYEDADDDDQPGYSPRAAPPSPSISR
ncbi:MAG: M36 family metallopeptidase [Flavobacteriales bacterium]|nr:M36 family metallopeptidase [Flavobacteriales bacterium]